MIEPQKWASTLGSLSDTVTLPDEDLQFASFKKLFPALTQVPLSEGGVAPQRTDFNTLFKLLGDNIFYIQQGGVFSYSDTADYKRGAFVKYNNELYLCIQDNSSLNIHAPTDTEYWEKITTITNLDYSNFFLDGAPQHNCIYRGKDITADFESGKFSENVANGTFKDIFVGDYIVKPVVVDDVTYNAKWVIGDCDYALHCGDTPLEEHHVLVFPDNGVGVSYMNLTNTTEGGYKGSYMYNTTMPKVRTAIKNAFGSQHLCTFREFLTSAVDTSITSMAGGGLIGASSANEWTTIEACDLMCESMVTGSKISSSCYDRFARPKIISAFSHNSSLRFTNLTGVYFWWWLRDVVSSHAFECVDGNGGVGVPFASTLMNVRPFVLLK